MVLLPPEPFSEAFSKPYPKCILPGFYYYIIRTDVIGDVFIKACFETPDAIPAMRSIVNLVAWWCTAEIMCYCTVFLRPLHNMPLDKMSYTIGSLYASTGTVFVGTFHSEDHSESTCNHIAFKIGKEELSKTSVGIAPPKGLVVLK